MSILTEPMDQRFIFKNNHRLKAFFYLLVRDYVPFGVIEKILMDLGDHDDFELENKVIADYAQQAVNRLMPPIKI